MRAKRLRRVPYGSAYWLVWEASREELADYLKIDKANLDAMHALDRLVEAARILSEKWRQ